MDATWRTSRWSVANGACVEVGRDTVILVRDTQDRGGQVLGFPPAAWAAFTASLKEGS